MKKLNRTPQTQLLTLFLFLLLGLNRSWLAQESTSQTVHSAEWASEVEPSVNVYHEGTRYNIKLTLTEGGAHGGYGAPKTIARFDFGGLDVGPIAASELTRDYAEIDYADFKKSKGSDAYNAAYKRVQEDAKNILLKALAAKEKQRTKDQEDQDLAKDHKKYLSKKILGEDCKDLASKASCMASHFQDYINVLENNSKLTPARRRRLARSYYDKYISSQLGRLIKSKDADKRSEAETIISHLNGVSGSTSGDFLYTVTERHEKRLDKNNEAYEEKEEIKTAREDFREKLNDCESDYCRQVLVHQARWRYGSKYRKIVGSYATVPQQQIHPLGRFQRLGYNQQIPGECNYVGELCLPNQQFRRHNPFVRNRLYNTGFGSRMIGVHPLAQRRGLLGGNLNLRSRYGLRPLNGRYSALLYGQRRPLLGGSLYHRSRPYGSSLIHNRYALARSPYLRGGVNQFSRHYPRASYPGAAFGIGGAFHLGLGARAF